VTPSLPTLCGMRCRQRLGARWDSRLTVVIVFVAASAVLLAAGVVTAASVLTDSLSDIAQQNATRDARLAAGIGIAAALSEGRLNQSDGPTARREFAAVRHDIPILRMLVWGARGRPVFGVPEGSGATVRRRPVVVTLALHTGRTQSDTVTEPGAGTVVEAAVPLRVPDRHLVAEFQFSRAGLEADLAAAKHRLYVIGGVGAVLLYLALLPVMARLVRRMPPPVDPVRWAAVRRLERALAHRELCVHYQPKIEVISGRVVGVEALVRWKHPERGLLAPAEFLPVAQTSPPLLAALTTYVLDLGVGDCARWRRRGLGLSVAVNIAASVLLDGPLVQTVQGALERHGLPAEALILEITENAIMERGPDIAAVLIDLRRLGVAISIDDFGTGHSSLARLQSLPLDELKVDGSFVRSLAASPRDLTITGLILDLAANLGLATVAEGVEDEQTLQLLAGRGCTIAQGFHIARPLPEERLLEWLGEQRVGPAAEAGTACPAPIQIAN
jgi:EAL domain-containing protein (putative c-di-GMP-specific phosphodiesterase class I)